MAMYKKCEIYFLKADPKRPNARYNKENPTWEVQLRTTDIEQRDEWRTGGLPVKLLTVLSPKEEGQEEEERTKTPVLTPDGKKIYRVNISKRSLDKEKKPAEAVKVINGRLEDIDPNTVGNGSVANVRVYHYEGKDKEGKPKTQSILMALQLTKYVLYTGGSRDDDFDTTDTETVMADDNDDEPASAAPAKKEVKAPPRELGDDF